MAREDELTATLLQLADTLVDDFDLVDLLALLVDRCVAVLGVAAAGLMLVAPGGDLRLAASSSEAMRIVELFELQTQEGPCLDAYHSGDAIVNIDLAASEGSWPRFTPVAIEAGFRTVHALPMQLRGTILGAINLFSDGATPMVEEDIRAGKAFADMGTIAILQHRAAIDAKTINNNLNNALNDRLLIEQAKGVLAERTGLEMEQGFLGMRSYARDHNLRLAEVAQRVIDGTLDSSTMKLTGSS